ncbi:MAG TPA: PIN domain-containing protein [Candidatus Desulfofervidus auxilii]|uniref:PIN domain-containing protein n=1 Tax=Desulfofervidus auxilii TaxID=1621989 RepID=A0A7C1ZSG0_DESA2|nr:PIN domain-containing protein [Candidatus Desulfofervidus auxilii]
MHLTQWSPASCAVQTADIGHFLSGPPAKILSHWRKGNFIAVISEPIILEYTRVAEEISQKFPQIEITEILGLFILNSEIVDPGGLEIRKCEDLADNKFLECAIAGGKEELIEIKEEQPLNRGHYFEFLDRTFVAMEYIYQFLGCHPVLRKDITSQTQVYQIDKSGFSDIFMMLDDEKTEDLVFLRKIRVWSPHLKKEA